LKALPRVAYRVVGWGVLFFKNLVKAENCSEKEEPESSERRATAGTEGWPDSPRRSNPLCVGV